MLGYYVCIGEELHIHMCVHMHVHMCACVCGDQRSTLGFAPQESSTLNF